MVTLQEGLELAIKAHACKGNTDAFEKVLAEGNELECYQIALGGHKWLIGKGIIDEDDLPDLERLAERVGRIYDNNGHLSHLIGYKNGKIHGFCREFYENGQLYRSTGYKNGKRHGLCEEWLSKGILYKRSHYNEGKMVTVHLNFVK